MHLIFLGFYLVRGGRLNKGAARQGPAARLLNLYRLWSGALSKTSRGQSGLQPTLSACGARVKGMGNGRGRPAKSISSLGGCNYESIIRFSGQRKVETATAGRLPSEENWLKSSYKDDFV